MEIQNKHIFEQARRRVVRNTYDRYIVLDYFRPPWDDYFIDLAWVTSSRATCRRALVGAVLVENKRIMSTGYNGSPPGQPHCLDEGCYMVQGHCVRTFHAERNAIDQYRSYFDREPAGAVLYVYFESLVDPKTHYFIKSNEELPLSEFPCEPCRDIITDAGIARVVVEYGSGTRTVYER
jgi:dCMP deaminase